MNNKLADRKFIVILVGGLIFSVVILTALFLLRGACIQWQNRVLLGVIGFSIIAAILVVWFNVVASSKSFKKRFPKWSSAPLAFNATLVIYFGILIISLSRYKELIDQLDWDPTMLALGIAVLAFGWTFVVQYFQDKKLDKQSEKLDKIEKNVKKATAN
jgi:hypothetical protein